MNLYRLELKRVCKTRMTAILLAIALVLAVVMAYLPVTFIGWTELDASGNEVRYTGLKAIRKRQEQQVSGTITPDVMQEVLEAYQRVYRQYDASSCFTTESTNTKRYPSGLNGKYWYSSERQSRRIR